MKIIRVVELLRSSEVCKLLNISRTALSFYVQQGKIDVVEVYTTDGRLYGSDLVILDDDLNFFPSYYGVTIIREESLKEYPDLLPVLNKLNGKITTEDMMRMNYEVDVEKKDPKDVAHEFLVQKGLISGR